MSGNGGRDGDVAAPLARWFLWVDSPAAVQRLQLGLYVLCAALVAFELVWHRHTYVPGEELFGYHAIVGFFAFLLIVLGAKRLRRLIRRDESYYGAASIDAERYPEAGLGQLDARDGDHASSLLIVRGGSAVGGRESSGAAAAKRTATPGGTAAGGSKRGAAKRSTASKAAAKKAGAKKTAAKEAGAKKAGTAKKRGKASGKRKGGKGGSRGKRS